MAVSFRLLLLIFIITLLNYTSFAQNQQPISSEIPLLDDEDPFFAPPRDFEKAALGTILRSRPVPKPLRLLKSQGELKVSSAWQILYRTQNSVGLPEANVVTVIVPYAPKKNNLFAFSYFTNAAFNRCNPSFALQSEDPNDNWFIHFQSLIVVAALTEGYIVSVADDTGPQAAYTAGLQMGYSTLDSLRAVLKSGNFTGLDAKPITTLYGYSGGAMASGWASELHPSYAPELDIAGVAIGGLIPNMTAVNFSNTEYTEFVPAAMLGLAHDYANMSTWMSANLVPKRATEFRRAESQCLTSSFGEYQNLNMSRYFKNGYGAFLTEAVPASVLRWAGDMGVRGTPRAPWYVYHGTGDMMSRIEVTDALVAKHCKAGASIFYERNTKPLDHGISEFYRYAGAMTWLKERHAGVPIDTGCSTRNVAIDSLYSLLPGEVSLLANGIIQNILGALGAKVAGPGWAGPG